MLGYANHLRLYAVQTGPRGRARDNFPQAFTHLGLISAVSNLGRTLGGHWGTSFGTEVCDVHCTHAHVI